MAVADSALPSVPSFLRAIQRTIVIYGELSPLFKKKLTAILTSKLKNKMYTINLVTKSVVGFWGLSKNSVSLYVWLLRLLILLSAYTGRWSFIYSKVAVVRLSQVWCQYFYQQRQKKKRKHRNHAKELITLGRQTSKLSWKSQVTPWKHSLKLRMGF